MRATIIPEIKKHYPVLLDEIISIITPQYGGSFIDCTFGQGGYTEKILEFPNTKVIAIDRDLDSKKIALNLNKKFEDRFVFYNQKFSDLNNLNIKNEKIKAIIFDLGYSFLQIKDPKKGLSFNTKGKLNMRMGLNNFSAKEVINKLDKKDLAKIFKFFGEEKDSNKIAYKIVQERKKKEIDTPLLVKIIESSKIKRKYKTHSATKVFQAIRIFVNKEVSELINGLINSFKILPLGGVIIVVTFHSIEDKIVKFFFKNYSENKNFSRYLPNLQKNKKIFKLINKKPILPSLKEIKSNPQSRSAKLRYAIKTAHEDNFEELYKKFKYLLEVENLSEKL